MLWSSLAPLAFLAAAPAGIWTGVANQALAPEGNRAVWEEYGLQSTEQADFGRYKAVAYVFKDTTGAYAAWAWLSASDRTVALNGNVVLTCAGSCPGSKELAARLDPKRVSRAPASLLPSYLPDKAKIAGSERYILGPASLAQFAVALPVSDMAFQFSTEAAVARYATPQGSLLLAIVSYPTPGIARQQAAEFRKTSGAVVKRSGPLVIVVPDPGDATVASALVSRISYQASISWDEKPPDPRFFSRLTEMLMAIGQLILFLIALCIVGGVSVGGARVVRKRFGKSTADGGVILLHLTGK